MLSRVASPGPTRNVAGMPARLDLTRSDTADASMGARAGYWPRSDGLATATRADSSDRGRSFTGRQSWLVR